MATWPDMPWPSARSSIGRRAGDLAVIGVDDAGSRDMAAWLETRPARVVRVSGPQVAAGRRARRCPARTTPRTRRRRPRWRGSSALPDDAIAAGLLSYPGLPHRQQRIVTIDGVTFINDSKATNADAAERALVCYDRLIWIAGGMAKEGGIEPLVPLFPRIARALLIGRDAPEFAATLTRHGVPFDIVGHAGGRCARRVRRRQGRRRAGRAAVAGLRQLGPVHRLRPARRPLRRTGASACSAGGA